MSALIRQVAVLSVLWAMCELLLPSGKQQQMVRMTVGVLVMTALLSTTGELLHSHAPAAPTLAHQAVQTTQESYRQTVLRAAANQAAFYCQRLAERSGYTASVDVFLTMEGAVERIELSLQERAALLSPQEVIRRMARDLQIDAEKIRLEVEP